MITNFKKKKIRLKYGRACIEFEKPSARVGSRWNCVNLFLSKSVWARASTSAVKKNGPKNRGACPEPTIFVPWGFNISNRSLDAELSPIYNYKNRQIGHNSVVSHVLKTFYHNNNSCDCAIIVDFFYLIKWPLRKSKPFRSENTKVEWQLLTWL